MMWRTRTENENRQLRVEAQRQREAVRDLQRHLLSPVSGLFGQRGSRAEDCKRIEALEAQIKICIDDFLLEHKDHDRAQARFHHLEQEADLIKRQLDRFQVSHMTRLHKQRLAALSNYHDEYDNLHGLV